MTGKVLIFGGSGGIGAATAKLLQARGYDLHLAGRNEARLSAVAEELGASFTVGDVLDDTHLAEVVQAAGESLDGLVYAVGTINLRGLQRLRVEDFLHDFRVNALGAALAIQAALPALKHASAGAAVVLFSSVAARQGFSLHASMGMAKGAVEGLVLSLAAELAPRVRVNAIAPSLTRTPLAETILPGEQMAASIARLHPIPRLGAAEDIAALAAYLLSPEAGWITGQIISVDGGRSTLRPRG